jgi:hypothetical protein
VAYTVRSSRSHRAHTDQVWFGSASRLGRRGNILSPAFVILASPLVTLQGTTPHPRDTRVLCTPSPLARSERATRPSSLVQCVRLCVTTPLQSERASLSITHARGGLALEDPAYDSSTTTAHLPDEIAQAVTSAIILLSNDEYHCRYDKSRLFLPDRQQNQIPATRLVLIISCLRQAARRQGLESISAYRILDFACLLYTALHPTVDRMCAGERGISKAGIHHLPQAPAST